MRPFPDLLREFAAGNVAEALTKDMAEVVAAVKENGGTGEVTLKITVKPNGPHGVAISNKITAKAPRAPFGESLFFLDDDANLLRNDPRQHELPLRKIDGGKPDYDPETGEVNE